MSINLHSQLQGISAFVHSVETGSFTAAADRMGLSKSATGKMVARLEARLDAQLLRRTTRSLSLTPEGQAYYESCRKVLEELDTAEALLASRQRLVSGKVRVNLPVSFGRLHCMPVLTQLLATHPALDLDVSFTDRRVDLIEEGIDLVVRLGDPGDQAHLVGRRIAWQRSVVCAAPGYLERRGRPSTIGDLAHHDCLAFARDGRPLPWTILDENGIAQSVSVRPRHTISHGEALLDAAVHGLGLAYLSTWLADDGIGSGELEVLPLATPAEEAAISILWPSSRHLAPKVRVVVDALSAAKFG
ncbi:MULTISPECIES: LysR family transcriptional regulator [unclassified Novosphingobium]|uniref:LysR family transcriptional regulator n=1 Tax=unclassified Novosphingobium TaxID=2644732 RepID=UPI001493EDBD|nr:MULTISPECIES: LysR family transcriptional regulator [unclassified Novosphingobium]MBB3356978.1 DNA-binding transcriptional LysR family regulator [Novosphingobium sp. BK256]MBB3373379.1 DNA-binding transcriptional LysR family regulator [Novosphingobium sp. BK280]MBB3377748.1 DNA-binding transcriptional LysR family regulator [Novosphingobium sp. BK258]MBB3418841.1 DNA-binding transcriptional LysR family regulator [Novosphingobium sp. BK267]MBB3450324.1 DNA-binding transcriptional LysR family 